MSVNTSDFLQNEASLPSDMFYNLKKSVMASRSYRVNIAPFNGSTFGPTANLIQCYIPARRNCWLNTTKSSYRFTVVNNATAAAADAETYTFDGSAYSVINKQEIYHGSNNIETIQQANVLYQSLLDLQTGLPQRNGLSSAIGCSNNTDRKGITITNALATSGNGGSAFTVQLPIISSIIGTLNPKYLNLNMSDDLRLEITIESLIQGMVLTGTATNAWTIIDFQLILDIVELNDDGMRLFETVSPKGSPQITCTNQYRHFSLPIVASSSAGYASGLIGAKFASTKLIMICPRRNTEVIDQLSYSVSSRINPCIASYQFKLGGVYLPARPVQLESGTVFGYCEALCETIKGYHLFNDLSLHTSLGDNYYNVVDNVSGLTGVSLAATASTAGVLSAAVAANKAANSYKNGFLICQDFESISNKGDLILSGIDTRFSQLYFEYSTNRAIGASSYILDIYVMYDALLILDPNGFYSIKF